MPEVNVAVAYWIDCEWETDLEDRWSLGSVILFVRH